MIHDEHDHEHFGSCETCQRPPADLAREALYVEQPTEYFDRLLDAFEAAIRAESAETLREAAMERWLARVEWNGNGSRAEWRCVVCGQYDRHRTDADDYCPVAWMLDRLAANEAEARS